MIKCSACGMIVNEDQERFCRLDINGTTCGSMMFLVKEEEKETTIKNDGKGKK